jgi:hypothetical protein
METRMMTSRLWSCSHDLGADWISPGLLASLGSFTTIRLGTLEEGKFSWALVEVYLL